MAHLSSCSSDMFVFSVSYVGAHQLGLDVAFMKSWLRQCITNESVRNTVLDLAILKSLNGAVLLLKRQEGGKRSSRGFRDSFRDESKFLFHFTATVLFFVSI